MRRRCSPIAMLLWPLALIRGSECLENTTAPATVAASHEGCFQSVTVRGSGGTLTTPNYPNKYPSGVDCRWLLTAEEPNATILLKINSLDVEPDTHCKLDYLQVYLGSTSLAPTLGPFCGRIRDRLLRTNASKVLLVFRSDPSHEDRGFSLDHFTQTTTECQDLLTDDSGTLRSPGFPNNYPDGTDCWTLVRVGVGRRILIEFDSVDMEYGDNCTFDYVQVFDGDNRNSTLLTQICSQTGSSRLESSSNSLLVHFHSDDSVGRKGYRATYTALDQRTLPTGNCLWQPSDSNGTVASPNHPANYPSHANCSLWIVAPGKQRILVLIDALQLEMEPGCPYDFLQIEQADSSTPSGPQVLGRYCGNEGEAKNLTSDHNELHIVFQSDDFMEFSGFKLRYFFMGAGDKANVLRDEGLSFSVVPQNATLEMGSSHTMHCATRQSSAKIRWLKGDTMLAGGSPLPGLRVLANDSLWIQRMDHPLAGVYTCMAVSPDSKTASAKAYVLVKNWPKLDDCGIVFRKPPKDSSFSEGEFAQLECLAAGRQVRVSWEKDGAPLSPGGRVTVLRNGYLFVDGALLKDAGVYTCVARDTGCERRASALVQVSRKIRVEEVCGKSKGVEPEHVPQMEHGKIIGGHDAKEGAHPWQVMLWEPSLKTFCGGTLLNERWIATAAHCFVNYRNLRWDRVVLKLGKRDREQEEADEFRTGIADPASVVVHPAYDRHTFDNDLALVRMREHVPSFGERILPACLGDDPSLLEGTTGIVAGWGKLKDDGPAPRFLQEIRLPVVRQEICLRSTNYTVTRNMFCAGYAQEILGDACHGDSGGPFLVERSGRWHLVGVVSWGEGCGKRNKYGFYTRLPNYTSWIRGIIKS